MTLSRDAVEQGHEYYVRNQAKYMQLYDRGSRHQRGVLAKHFDESQIDTWIPAARLRFQALLPEVPYIGGDDNGFTQDYVFPSVVLPWAHILRDEGLPIRKIGQLIVELGSAGCAALSSPAREQMGRAFFSEKKKDQWREVARQSQVRQYPGDWVVQYVEGDGETFDYGLDMIECARLKLWRAQGLEEFVPYLCLADWPYWRAIGVEAKRTQTLACGGTCCDDRYIRRGRDGPVGWPPESLPEWTGRYEG